MGAIVLAIGLGTLACGQSTTEDPMLGGTGGQTVDGATGGQASSGGTGGSSSAGGAGGTSAGGSDNAATGGSGSGGEPPLCPAIVPVCEPGSEGCSHRGETYLCTECGQMDLQGQACTRLITADKEAGLICVIHGEDELSCVGGATEWSEALEFPVPLPGFATKLSLPDDSTGSTQAIAYCFIDETQAIGCTEGLTAPGSGACTDVAVTDGPTVCSVCDGTLVCSRDDVNVPDVTAVVASDSAYIWLNAAGKLHWSVLDEPVLPGTFSSFFVDDNQTPCGIEPGGELVCAREGSDETVGLSGPFVQGSAGSAGLRCAVAESGELSCFVFDEDGLAPSFSPVGTFTQVAVSIDRACALTQVGEVVCWDTEGLLDDWTERLNP